jgi:tol-pal system-associated acyl-CoA thioesterase
MQKKIYYHDTDAGGVVYYANYLKFLEEARTEFFAQRNISIKEFIEKGILFVVSRQEIDYKFPAFYADTLSIDTRVSKVGAATIEFDYKIKNQRDRIVVEARTILACVGNNFKPKAIPDELRKWIS